jgi:hypothetical protein
VFRDKQRLALLDSGAELSVIGRNLIPKDILKPTRHELYTAAGNPLPLLGETTLEFEVNGYTTKVEVVVTNLVHELILGIDWLHDNSCNWSFGSRTFAINGHAGKLRCKKNNKGAVKQIIVRQDTEVPGYHQVNVPVYVTQPSLTILEKDWASRHKVLDEDLVVASTIYLNTDIETMCGIMNLSNNSGIFRAGQLISEADPVIILDDEILSTTSPLEENLTEQQTVANGSSTVQYC